ncbi:DUF7547 family protein [Natrarchaeobaculum aegyptiacum]|uniref:Uncharacterized protein n=1 Tax=Natrarchaeobaculum aegyptiacum TaxID=745377 RepID=A0A2Z2HUL1_9EURY|nr:hypothetical protein [Natrarchaeobaculum aegyptiacum]ARS88714.1 hypothetical protein B1756_02375 [Natrarchaeobaculum aegyptiacum]
MADQDDDLAEAIRELTRTLEEVGEELGADRSRSPLRDPTGSMPRPPLRPPTPREFLAFTDEVALPALLAALESSVRTLEAFQRAIRLVRTEREARDRVTETADVTSDRATDLRRTTLDHLDTVLAELQRATTEGTLPADDRARELLEEARDLRDDVDDRLRRAAESSDRDRPSGGVQIDVQSGSIDHRSRNQDGEQDAEPEPDDKSAVDVDAELETLKDRYGQDDIDTDDDTAPATDGEEVDADDSDSNGTDDADDDGPDGDDTDGANGDET